MISQTQLLNQTLALTDDPDAISYKEQDGHPFIVLGNVSLSLETAGQAAIDKLATVAAQAASATRAHSLKAVS